MLRRSRPVRAGQTARPRVSTSAAFVAAALVLPAAASAGPLKATSFVQGTAAVPGQPGPTRAFAGDLHADGKDDAVFGNGLTATVLFGTSPSADADLRADIGARGFSVTSGALGPIVDVDPAGDFDRDGVDDLLVSTDLAAWVVYGGRNLAGPIPLVAGSRATEITTGATTGGDDIAGIGDFDGDGYDDVAVQRGTAGSSIVLGGPRVAKLTATAVGSRTSLIKASQRCGVVWFTYGCVSLGVNFEPLGDFDADGKADLAIESTARDGNFVLYGRTGTFTTSPSAQTGATTRLPSGTDVPQTVGNITRTGDVNGDGFDDALSWGHTLILGRAGRPASITATSPLIKLTSAAGDEFTVEPVGDQNADGRDDLAVHSSAATPGQVRLVTAIPRTAPGTIDVDAGTLVAGLPAEVDASIEGLGDLDGDGLGDLIVGTSYPGESAYLVTHGTGTPGNTKRVAVLNAEVRLLDAASEPISGARVALTAVCNGVAAAPTEIQYWGTKIGEFSEGDACTVRGPDVALDNPGAYARCTWRDDWFIDYVKPIPSGSTFTLKAADNHFVVERRCQLPADAPPASFQTPGWIYSGSAYANGARVELNDLLANQTGSVMWPIPIDLRQKTIQFDIRIAGGTGAAEGLTLAFVRPDGNGQPSGGRLGAGGPQLGFGGLGGVAVAIDTKRDTGDPSANFMGFTDGANGGGGLRWLRTAVASTQYRASAGHTIKVVNKNGTTEVFVNGRGRIRGEMPIPAQSFLAFTGATGSIYQLHSVLNLKITDS